MAKQTPKTVASKVETPKAGNVAEVETPKPEAPKVTAPKVEVGSKGEKMTKVKFIKKMPRLKISGKYYSGEKDETVNLPIYIAQVVKGNFGRGTQFAV